MVKANHALSNSALIDKLTMTFNRPIMGRTQILVHRWGPEQGFQRCSSETPNQCIVSSVAQAKSHVMKQLEATFLSDARQPKWTFCTLEQRY